MVLPARILPGRLPTALVEATIIYRVDWASGSFANFRWFEDAEREAVRASRAHGEACIGEYHHDPVDGHRLMNTLRYKDGREVKTVKRRRRKKREGS